MQNNIDLKSAEDTELVLLSQQGDHAAFTELVARNRTNCMKLALSILRNREDAEDEVQTAMWKAYQHIGRFQQDAKFSTWLTRIVVNQCLMRLRKNKRARLWSLDELAPGDDSKAFDLPDSRDNPEQILAAGQVRDTLGTEIGRVPPLLRNVFVLREVEQLPMRDVAGRLGITVAAAKSRLLRARKELGVRMDRHTGRLGPATLYARAS